MKQKVLFCIYMHSADQCTKESYWLGPLYKPYHRVDRVIRCAASVAFPFALFLHNAKIDASSQFGEWWVARECDTNALKLWSFRKSHLCSVSRFPNPLPVPPHNICHTRHMAPYKRRSCPGYSGSQVVSFQRACHLSCHLGQAGSSL